MPEVDVIVVGDSSDENEHYVVSDSSSPRSRYDARAFLIPACAVNITFCCPIPTVPTLTVYYARL